MKNSLESLKDIKAMENISIDFSIYIISFSVIILLMFFYFLIKYFIKKSKIKVTKAKIAQKYLKNMDFTKDSRQVAYDFTIYAYICLNPKFQDEYEDIISKLEAYKYKKQIQAIDEDLIKHMKKYIKAKV